MHYLGLAILLLALTAASPSRSGEIPAQPPIDNSDLAKAWRICDARKLPFGSLGRNGFAPGYEDCAGIHQKWEAAQQPASSVQVDDAAAKAFINSLAK